MQDKQLGTKLRSEYPGILTWMVQGCQVWLREGMTLPEKVKAATAAYRTDEDLLAQFLSEHCRLGQDYRCKAAELNDRYQYSGASPCSRIRKSGPGAASCFDF
jgi:putative DNA primase/helicase